MSNEYFTLFSSYRPNQMKRYFHISLIVHEHSETHLSSESYKLQVPVSTSQPIDLTVNQHKYIMGFSFSVQYLNYIRGNPLQPTSNSLWSCDEARNMLLLILSLLLLLFYKFIDNKKTKTAKNNR